MNARPEKNARHAPAPDPRDMRCATVTAQVGLAVAKLLRTPKAFEPELAASLSDIAGVLQVHVDSARAMVHILYNNRLGAAEEVHRFLVATGWSRTVATRFQPATIARRGHDPHRSAPALSDHDS